MGVYMKKDCPECGTVDALYKTLDNHYKCWKCKYKYSITSDFERPIRPANADCGEIIEKNNGKTEVVKQKRMCSDGSFCQMKTTGLREMDGEYVVVCTTHQE